MKGLLKPLASMPRKRDLLVEGGGRFDDGELHAPNRAPKKTRRAQLNDDDGANEAAASLGANGKHDNASSSGGDTDTAGEAGDDGTSNSEDEGELQKVHHHRQYAVDGAHAPPMLRTSALARKDRESQANKDVENGRSDSESDGDASENEEIEEGIVPRRRGMANREANDDTSQSGSSSSDSESGEEEEEFNHGEKRLDESTAFGRAFQKIMKKKLPSTALTEAMGPMLSAHKQLVTKKLEEAAEGRKVKSESKKAKQALREKGHTVPALFPAAKDKELLKLATRGVVKLFNAVSKAQSVQEAAISKDSEAKEVAKRSKSTFLAMLQGGNGAVSQSLNTQRQPSDSKKKGVADGQPGWSALQETFMLGKSRLKDWDKKEEDAAELRGAGSSGDDSDSSD